MAAEELREDQPVESVVDEQAEQPIPMTEVRYWDNDLDDLIYRWRPFKDVELTGRNAEQRADWDAFMWQNYLHQWDQIREVSLLVGQVMARLDQLTTPEKPKAKRVRVPKAAMPETDDAA